MLWKWLEEFSNVDVKSILEVGCGPYGFAPFYASISDKYVGIDIDDYTNYYGDVGNASIIKYDGVHFPLRDESIDLVVSHSVFEHVMDVRSVIEEVHRVLRVGGEAFISINPLYYSSWGSHGTEQDNTTRLPPWDHLNPQSPNYLTDCPPQMVQSGHKGCYINKLTMSDLLYEFGRLPFSILRLDRIYETMELPPFLKDATIPESQLRNSDFRVLLRKDAMR